MTLLTIVQGMCDSLALDRPANVIGNADGITREMLGALNDAGNEMATENDPPFAGLTRFGTFTSVASEMQGALSTIAPDFGYLINDTLWDTSNAWPTEGAITPQQWALLVARGGVAPYGKFRMLINPATNKMSIYVYPIPGAGETFTFEYVSKNWVLSPTPQTSGIFTWTSFQTDNDTVFYNEQALKLQAIWRFRMTKGADDWQMWKQRADDFTSGVKTQEVGTSSFRINGWRGIHLVDLSNIQDGNFPGPS